MKRSKFSEHIVGGAQAGGGRGAGEGPVQEAGISNQTSYNWKAKYSGLGELRPLNDERERLQPGVDAVLEQPGPA
jgi:hypothetical protein